ncbi:MAG: hypothetical protein IJD14_04110, partial [Christensenellaceae bacterium]|nr:hypothetical protein [Christensenellaceae bacterium]
YLDPNRSRKYMDNKKHKIQNGKWDRVFDYDFNKREFFTISTDNYIIQITGGSLIIFDKKTNNKLNQIKGYNYLYTGDVKPDEKELFALENGKHFYIISLEDFTQKLRVTLPRSYESIDVFGSFSDDGELLYVPIRKYVDNQYKYWLCEYETVSYSLAGMKEISKSEVTFWPDDMISLSDKLIYFRQLTEKLK